MAYAKRRNGRVEFDPAIPVRLSAPDGAWRRDGVMADVSQGGARLVVDGDICGLDMSDFLLILTENGRVHRRCRLVHVNGRELGIRFMWLNGPQQEEPKMRLRAPAPAAPSPP